VKLFVDAMGGKIGVFSDGVGKGSTFWFTLPRKKIVKSSGEKKG
jgi:signal transduction histidine kinase